MAEQDAKTQTSSDHKKPTKEGYQVLQNENVRIFRDGSSIFLVEWNFGVIPPSLNMVI
jgi:hypothetical protein